MADKYTSSHTGQQIDDAVDRVNELPEVVDITNKFLDSYGFPRTDTPYLNALPTDIVLDAFKKLNKLPDLVDVLDITSLFTSTESNPLNEAQITKIQNKLINSSYSNGKKLFYIGPGNYYLSQPIYLSADNTTIICLGTIYGPTTINGLKSYQDYRSGTTFYDKVVRALFYHSGSGNNVYIKKIVVRNNYCAFYDYYSKNCSFDIGSIIGDYTTSYSETVKVPRSLFGMAYDSTTVNKKINNVNVSCYRDAETVHRPIPDDWYLNSGFMATSMQDDRVTIGVISNLNYGLWIVNTIPTALPSGYSEFNISKKQIQLAEFNVKAIDCKKGIVLDLARMISLTESANGYTTSLVDSGFSERAYIHGCRFNINSFDHYSTSINTNWIETMNPDFYEQNKDNKRYMFFLRSVSGKNQVGGNIFNSLYIQGVYDQCVYAENVLGVEFSGVVQVNDLWFNNWTDVAQRHDRVRSTRYRQGKQGDYPTNNIVANEGQTDSSGKVYAIPYYTARNIDVGPVLVFKNCKHIKFFNTGADFFRFNPALVNQTQEISVDSNSQNIYIDKVGLSDTQGDYHSTTSLSNENVDKLISVVYGNGTYYYKRWNDSYISGVTDRQASGTVLTVYATGYSTNIKQHPLTLEQGSPTYTEVREMIEAGVPVQLLIDGIYNARLNITGLFISGEFIDNQSSSLSLVGVFWSGEEFQYVKIPTVAEGGMVLLDSMGAALDGGDTAIVVTDGHVWNPTTKMIDTKSNGTVVSSETPSAKNIYVNKANNKMYRYSSSTMIKLS